MKKQPSRQAGFTILETLIFLAVSGALFVTVAASISGSQQQTEYEQGVKDLETKIMDVANDVYQGYFPASGSGEDSCDVHPVLRVRFTGVKTTQGNNAECIFAGKAVQFHPDGANGEFQMKILTLVTRRIADNGLPVTSLADLTVGDIKATHATSGTLTMTSTEELPRGFRVRSVADDNTTPFTVAFISGFSTTATSGSSSYTGAPETEVRTITGSERGDNDDEVQDRLENPTNYVDLPAGGLRLCIEQGADGRRALLVLGRDGRKLTITSSMEPRNAPGTRICD